MPPPAALYALDAALARLRSRTAVCAFGSGRAVALPAGLLMDQPVGSDARDLAPGRRSPNSAPFSPPGAVPPAADLPSADAPPRVPTAPDTAPQHSPGVVPPHRPGATPQRPATAPPSSPRRRRALLLLLLLAILIGGVLFWHPWAPTPAVSHDPTAGGGLHGGPGGAPQAVGVATAAPGDVAISLTELGTITPLATVTVKTQINGILTQVAFTEGQLVRRGDFLAQIDPRPYQALLDQYEGNLARDQALLADAQLDLARYQRLNVQDSIARQSVDTQAALVRQDQGTIKADQALIDSQKLNLIYCHITSPVDGRVGLRQVDQGNYVTTGDANGIVVVTTLQPITAIFTLPEDNIPAVAARTRSGATLPVEAWDRADARKIGDGALLTLDTQIDPTTGTVKARASFPNADFALFPQQFVNAHLLVDTLHAKVLVPNAAVQRGTPGTFVYLLAADSTVSVRKVETGPSDIANTAIDSGLAPGDRVVVDGADRLHDGAKVSVPADHAGEPDATPSGRHHRHGQ